MVFSSLMFRHLRFYHNNSHLTVIILGDNGNVVSKENFGTEYICKSGISYYSTYGAGNPVLLFELSNNHPRPMTGNMVIGPAFIKSGIF